jgi:hypothetical protein
MSQPFNPFGPAAPPPPRTSSGKILLIVLGLLGTSGLLCCGMCGGLAYWGIQEVHREAADKIIEQYAHHPIVVSQIGVMQTCQGNLTKGLNDDDHEMVFDVRGERGSGTIHVDTLFNDVINVQLRTAKGKWQLDEEAEPADDSLPINDDSP